MEDNKIFEDSKRVKKNKKDNSNILIIVIIILCILVAFLSGIIVYNFLGKKNNDSNRVEDKIDNNVTEDIVDDNVQEDKVDNNVKEDNVTSEKDNSTSANNNNNNNNSSNNNNNTDFVPHHMNSKLKKIMRALGDCGDVVKKYFTDKKVVAADISNELAYKAVVHEFYDQRVSVSADTVLQYVKEYFGSDYNYKHDVYKGCYYHTYNPASNLYEYFYFGGCGCTSGPNEFIKYNVSNFHYDGDLLILNVKVLFPSEYHPTGEYHKYYSDVARTKEIVGLTYSEASKDWLEGAIPIDSDANYAKGGNYKVVLKKVRDDIYSFVSSEPVA